VFVGKQLSMTGGSLVWFMDLSHGVGVEVSLRLLLFLLSLSLFFCRDWVSSSLNDIKHIGGKFYFGCLVL